MRTLAICLLCVFSLQAETISDLMGGSLGRPSAPPILGFLAIAGPGTFLTDTGIAPRGPVAKSVVQEFTLDRDGSLKLSLTTALEFDAEGREVLRREEGANHVGRISTTVWEGTRRLRVTFAGPGAPSIRDWRYDSLNRPIEYTVRFDGKIQNHYTNFRHDAQGRLLSLDYRQGPDDSLQSREEFSYSGNEVTHKRLKANGTILSTVTTTLDTAGRVVNAKIQSPGTQPITVIFSYDSRGRLLRQEATDLPLPAGDPLGTVPPGLVTLTWDDEKHTKRSWYSTQGQTLESTLTFDANGDIVAAQLTGILTRFDCSYDGHGNWTECTQYVGSAAKSRWHRTLTYR